MYIILKEVELLPSERLYAIIKYKKKINKLTAKQY